MKNMFKKYGSFCAFALLLCFYLASCGKTAKIENDLLPNVTSSDRAEECELIISGRIVNTKNLAPIEGAMVKGTLFEAETDENGEFSVSLSLTEDDIIDDISVTKEGFLIKEFKAYLGSVVQLKTCPLVTNISWDIALSERQEGVWVGPKDGAWYKVMDTVATQITNNDGLIDTVLIARTYTIDVRRGSLDDWAQVFVSPDNSGAVGPGIPSEIRAFLVELLRIEVNPDLTNSSNTSSSNAFVFDKPLDIRWTIDDIIDPETLTSIDLENLGIQDTEISINSDGEFVFLTTQAGLQAIGGMLFIENIVIPVLEAIQNGEPIEPIEAALLDGLEAIGNLDGNPTGIFTDTESNGRIANQSTLSNCECGNPVIQSFSAELEGFENIIITSPPITPEQAQQAFNLIRTLVGASANQDQSVSVNISLDKCQSKVVTSQEIVRTVTGVVMGYPFTYQATDRLETTEISTDCPTTSTCHQGCPG